MAIRLLRIHSETVLPLAFAASSTVRYSAGVRRTRRYLALALPLGSGGRPGLLTFFFWLKASELLHDGGSDGGLRRYDWRDVQDGHVMLRIRRIAGIVRPSVYPVCLRMIPQTENFHDAIPYDLTPVPLRDRYAFNMRGTSLVQFVDHIAQLFDMGHGFGFLTSRRTLYGCCCSESFKAASVESA